MIAYEELLQEAEDNNIEVIEFTFRGTNKGMYADGVIAIRRDIETVIEKKCILCEELEHAYTTVGDITGLETIQNRKQEQIARNRSFERLIPLKSIIKASFTYCTSLYELAEHLDVTEEFLKEAIEYYQSKYGLYKEVDNYCIYFSPLTVCKYKYEK
ncbi:ImmA/IrrE family metallo-endopeptidase [Sedimentibacter sp.]|uniref:ImmA/IrrE family metallo-endopeptidase n=1 Tax=Sedimentibacter sp. TaxID=1960295 RepID=UPI0028A8629D|nr:ImmA/IrrE family metallo-endopeptidase [Sedimentibacter sp.]